MAKVTDAMLSRVTSEVESCFRRRRLTAYGLIVIQETDERGDTYYHQVDVAVSQGEGDDLLSRVGYVLHSVCQLGTVICRDDGERVLRDAIASSIGCMGADVRAALVAGLRRLEEAEAEAEPSRPQSLEDAFNSFPGGVGDDELPY